MEKTNLEFRSHFFEFEIGGNFRENHVSPLGRGCKDKFGGSDFEKNKSYMFSCNETEHRESYSPESGGEHFPIFGGFNFFLKEFF